MAKTCAGRGGARDKAPRYDMATVFRLGFNKRNF